MGRKHISLKTKLASTLLALQDIPYIDAKQMTADQIISLYQWDHNELHAHEGSDEPWNLTPMLIAAHRTKTKQDAKIIAKSKRIRAATANPVVLMAEAFGAGWKEGCSRAFDRIMAAEKRAKKRKLRSRGFDKRFKRKLDGTVVKR